MNKEYREDLFLECTFTIYGEALPKNLVPRFSITDYLIR